MSTLAPPETALEEREEQIEAGSSAALDASSAEMVEPGELEAEALELEDTSAPYEQDLTGEISGPVEEQLDPRRVHALEPFYGKLMELLAQHRDMEAPSQVNIAEDGLYISKWERDLTLVVLEEGGAGQPGWVPRVADAVAVQAKCLVDLDRLAMARSIRPELLHTVRQDLVMAEALGKALAVELQKVIDGMVVSGEMGTAKKLSQLRNRLKSRTDMLRDVLDKEETERAAELAEEFVSIPSDALLPDPPNRKRRRRRHREREPHVVIHSSPIAREASRVKTYAAILLTLVAAWTGLVLWPMYSQPTLDQLTLRDFRNISEVQAVKARAPSLFVTIDGKRWDEMGQNEREFVVDATSRIAVDSGYTGVVFSTNDGRQVAQWLVKTGKRIFPQGMTDS